MKKIIVIGNGMVGNRFCEKIIALAGPELFSMKVFGEENTPAYDRVHLSEYFKGRDSGPLMLTSREWYEENSIELITGNRITSIERYRKIVMDANEEEHAYDHLVLATGSYPFVPPIPGVDKKGVFVYRTIDDLDAIIDYSTDCSSAAVIGGGLLGLEAAKAAMDLGLRTHVVEFASRLMPRQLDESGADFLREKIVELGVGIHLNRGTDVVAGNGRVTGLEFNTGDKLDVDMVIVSAGIRPRDELARDAGLNMGERGGVIVDDKLRTSDPSIFAIGEVALHDDMIYGLVAPGYEMAETVARGFLGEDFAFTGSDMSTQLKLIGVDVASFGDAFGETAGSRPVVYLNRSQAVYKKLIVSGDGAKLLGGILVGDASDYAKLKQLIDNEVILPRDLDALIFSGEGGMPEVELSADAQICKCNDVSTGTVVDAIVQDGICDLAELKKCTNAGTGCGGCLPLVSDVLKKELKKQGREVDTRLCEHFDYSRTELLGIIKVKKLETFREVVKECGRGAGCEICKPAVASILASLWSEVIAKKEHAVIQDTNDRFLANIQRGGTYSVIPRVPGGEITPDQLIRLGEVAKNYDLYCKITGGQRVDLLGARVDQLPSIWEDLLEVGFESGHAYGKALRTVKSCVGSTWCRYGVQDSTSMAIRIEERYRGLRAPHKLKSAVSGCIRECAEAQSKDFGIIATEKGWNLYVCGNGGANPQHAKLLASDLDDDTLIKYIDRFLMYYIRTADKLTRTAGWFNNLEGGMQHLQEVIIDDSLNIGAELEADMQRHVDTYKCEWREVVENPELRKHYRHFANVDEADPALQFERERGQKRPADWETPVVGVSA